MSQTTEVIKRPFWEGGDYTLKTITGKIVKTTTKRDMDDYNRIYVEKNGKIICLPSAIQSNALDLLLNKDVTIVMDVNDEFVFWGGITLNVPNLTQKEKTE